MPHLALIPDAAPNDEADALLLQRIAAGDRLALASLYRPYYRRLDRFLTRMTRRADLIEEVINDTFWIVWQKAGEFRGDSRVSTWVMGIAYRCALKSLRQHGSDPVDPDEHGSSPHHLFDPGVAREINDWVSKGLRQLNDDQRMTLELAYGGGHSLEEIAAIMGCAVGTVKARMFHARVKLRNLLPLLANAAQDFEQEATNGPTS